MLYSFSENKIEPVEFAEIKGREKDLEVLIAHHMEELFVEESQLMTIFQERSRQEEADILSLDRYGNLVIFELKKNHVKEDAIMQIMRYAQKFGQFSYERLNKLYAKYHQRNKNLDLKEAHREAFDLSAPLPEDSFNTKQKLILIGNSTDTELMRAVDYWKLKGIEIDYIPYRFYHIGNKEYFELFSKPYDYHFNPKERKGIIFDTCRSHEQNAVWDMLKNNKISAYGNVRDFVDRFKKGDMVLYYHKGFGIIAVGKIISSKSQNVNDWEKYQKVEFLTPIPSNDSELKYISTQEIRDILGKNFFWASTVKTPYLSILEVDKLIAALQAKYKS